MMYIIALLSPFDTDYNTSGTICIMINLFVYTSILSTLIIQHLPKSLCCFLCITLTIVNVVYCILSCQCGTHAFWVTQINLVPHMVSTPVFIFLPFVKIENINWGKIHYTDCIHICLLKHPIFVVVEVFLICKL